jgi:hypothetical protein
MFCISDIRQQVRHSVERVTLHIPMDNDYGHVSVHTEACNIGQCFSVYVGTHVPSNRKRVNTLVDDALSLARDTPQICTVRSLTLTLTETHTRIRTRWVQKSLHSLRYTHTRTHVHICRDVTTVLTHVSFGHALCMQPTYLGHITVVLRSSDIMSSRPLPLDPWAIATYPPYTPSPYSPYSIGGYMPYSPYSPYSPGYSPRYDPYSPSSPDYTSYSFGISPRDWWDDPLWEEELWYNRNISGDDDYNDGGDHTYVDLAHAVEDAIDRTPRKILSKQRLFQVGRKSALFQSHSFSRVEPPQPKGEAAIAAAGGERITIVMAPHPVCYTVVWYHDRPSCRGVCGASLKNRAAEPKMLIVYPKRRLDENKHAYTLPLPAELRNVAAPMQAQPTPLRKTRAPRLQPRLLPVQTKQQQTKQQRIEQQKQHTKQRHEDRRQHAKSRAHQDDDDDDDDAADEPRVRAHATIHNQQQVSTEGNVSHSICVPDDMVEMTDLIMDHHVLSQSRQRSSSHKSSRKCKKVDQKSWGHVQQRQQQQRQHQHAMEQRARKKKDKQRTKQHHDTRRHHAKSQVHRDIGDADHVQGVGHVGDGQFMTLDGAQQVAAQDEAERRDIDSAQQRDAIQVLRGLTTERIWINYQQNHVLQTSIIAKCEEDIRCLRTVGTKEALANVPLILRTYTCGVGRLQKKAIQFEEDAWEEFQAKAAMMLQ